MAIPQGTQIPKSSSQFANLEEGGNRFRFLSDVVVGWEGWKSKKPFRHAGAVCQIKAEDVDLNMNGKPAINYFWAVVVWNYAEKQVQVLELTQKTIMNPLYEMEQNEDWGDLKNYDVQINKKKEGDKTTYTVMGIPPKPVSAEILEAYNSTTVELDKLFEGGYPISDDGSVDIEDILFN